MRKRNLLKLRHRGRKTIPSWERVEAWLELEGWLGLSGRGNNWSKEKLIEWAGEGLNRWSLSVRSLKSRRKKMRCANGSNSTIKLKSIWINGALTLITGALISKCMPQDSLTSTSWPGSRLDFDRQWPMNLLLLLYLHQTNELLLLYFTLSQHPSSLNFNYSHIQSIHQ